MGVNTRPLLASGSDPTNKMMELRENQKAYSVGAQCARLVI